MSKAINDVFKWVILAASLAISSCGCPQKLHFIVDGGLTDAQTAGDGPNTDCAKICQMKLPRYGELLACGPTVNNKGEPVLDCFVTLPCSGF